VKKRVCPEMRLIVWRRQRIGGLLHDQGPFGARDRYGWNEPFAACNHAWTVAFWLERGRLRGRAAGSPAWGQVREWLRRRALRRVIER